MKDGLIPTHDPEKFIETVPFINVSEKPLFNGGNPMTEFWKYIAEHVNYPQEAIDNGVEGRVTLRFVINEKGKMTQCGGCCRVFILRSMKKL